MSKPSGPQVKVVWAKVKGYPWWPALMNCSSEYSEKSKERLIVRFIGENSHAEVKSDMVKDFASHFQQHSHMKNKKLLNAIKIARELEDDIVKVSNTLLFESQTLLDSKKDHDKASADYQTKAADGFPHAELSDKGQPPKEQSHVETVQVQQSPSPHQQVSAELQPHPMRKARSSRCQRHINRIPLRKYEQITLEGRIVELMNNLKLGRQCSNDLQRIFKRLGKIKHKQVMNRYILSGLMTLQKLLPVSNVANLLSAQLQLTEHINSIRQRAVQLLNNTEGMREELIEQTEGSMGEPSQRLTVRDKKREIVRTIHHILKVKQPDMARQQFRDRSLEIYESWQNFVGEDNGNTEREVTSLTRLLRQLRTLSAQVIKSDSCVEVLKQHLADTLVG